MVSYCIVKGAVKGNYERQSHSVNASACYSLCVSTPSCFHLIPVSRHFPLSTCSLIPLLAAGRPLNWYPPTSTWTEGGPP